ncbi:MAG: hypothetical protein HQK99_17250 [Nitrospirae bacterium]|nr:hypothetical protein [Nitrospirota bacterium]
MNATLLIILKTMSYGKVVQTASYTMLGINQRGYKEVLGIYPKNGS